MSEEPKSVVAGPSRAVRVTMASSLISFLSLPTLIIYPFGIFAIAIAEHSGLAKQQVAAMIGPALLANIITQPLVGWIVQRFPKPAIAVAAMIGASLGLLLLSLAPATPVVFVLALTLATVLTSAATPTIVSALVSETFDRRRGLVLGTVMALTGLGIALLPVLVSSLIGGWGWRGAYVGLSILAGAGALLNFILLRGVSTSRPTGSASEATTLSALTRDPTFWIIALFFFLLAVVANAIPMHLPLILQERGAAPQIRALSLTVLGFTMIVSRPLLGWAVDRLPVRWVLAIMVVGPLAGSALLLNAHGEVAALISAIGFGLAIGGEFVCLGYMVSRGFPLNRFGAIYGWLSLVLALGVAAGPMAISALVKATGGYGAALMMMVAASVLALIVCAFLKDSRFRADGAIAVAGRGN